MLCIKCNEDKPLSKFRYDKRLKSGYYKACGACIYKEGKLAKKIKDKKKSKAAVMSEDLYCDGCSFLDKSNYVFKDGTNSLVCIKDNKFIAFTKSKSGYNRPLWCTRKGE